MTVPPVIAVTTWRRALTTVVAEDQLLYTLAADYVQCLERAGACAVLLPTLEPGPAAAVVARFDALLVSGGPDIDPALYGRGREGARDTDTGADRSDIALVRAAQRGRMPVLGVCRGLQVLNVALGGTLRQEVTGASAAHPTRPTDRSAALAYRHRVTIVPGSLLARSVGATERSVTSLHHQGIAALAPSLAVSARASDGLIEGVESRDPDWWALGVQWHPEKMGGADAALFAAFVAAARAAARGVSSPVGL